PHNRYHYADVCLTMAAHLESTNHSPRETRAGRRDSTPFASAAIWLVGLAAAALVLCSVGGYYFQRRQLNTVATSHLRLIVAGPASLHRGASAEFLISATAIDGLPATAEIETVF